MLFLNRLPRLHHPLLKNRRFTSGVTHDRFFIVIETADSKYSEGETRKLLEEVGSDATRNAVRLRPYTTTVAGAEPPTTRASNSGLIEATRGDTAFLVELVRRMASRRT